MNFFSWYFASGDSPFFFHEQLQELSLLPRLWQGENGIGQTNLPFLWIDYPFRFITSILVRIGFNWFIIDKIWWGSIFLLTIYSSFRLAQRFKLSNNLSIVSSLIYSTNTYIFLIFDGGQLGVALAYALFPTVFSCLITFLLRKSASIYDAIQLGLLYGVLICFDLRIGFIFSLLLISVQLFLFIKKKYSFFSILLIVPLIAICLNLFWILPSIQYPQSFHTIVEQTKANGEDLSFFSVADLPHSISLLHPNFPANLFGRVYFFKPEFLIIPILAFLFLLTSEESYPVYLIALVGLIGTFLSKGVKQPFGEIYELLYNYLPGFSLFRDPTKWYILTATSYSILIPLGFSKIIKKFRKGFISVGIVSVFVIFWIFSLRLLFLGKTQGNITPPQLSLDYELLKTTLISDPTTSRTLWLPNVERFGFINTIHPGVDANIVFKESSTSGIINELKKTETLSTIQSYGVGYIVVPEDIERKIFLDDYKYKNELRQNILDALSNLHLQKLSQFNRLAVYKIPSLPFFSLLDKPIKATPVSTDQWNLTIPSRHESSSLLVRIAYDPNWLLTIKHNSFKPVKTGQNFMIFILPPGLEEDASLFYLPHKVATLGAILSWISISFFSFILLKKKYAK